MAKIEIVITLYRGLVSATAKIDFNAVGTQSERITPRPSASSRLTQHSSLASLAPSAGSAGRGWGCGALTSALISRKAKGCEAKFSRAQLSQDLTFVP